MESIKQQIEQLRAELHEHKLQLLRAVAARYLRLRVRPGGMRQLMELDGGTPGI